MNRYKKLREVFPGDIIKEEGSKSLNIYKDRSYVYGTLCKVNEHLFVVSKTKRYQCYIDDLVIGKVIFVSSDYYKIDLGSYIAVLPSLNFTNASKRNKPDIKKDDWLFCKVISVGVEPLVSCVGEGFGKIEGNIFKLEVWKTQVLYMKNILYNLGKKHKFIIIIGLNGYVSISGESCKVVRDVYEELKKIDEI